VKQIVDEISRQTGARRGPLSIPIWGGRMLAASVEFSFGLIARTPPISRRSLKFFTNDAGFTCAKAEAMLGFKPRYDLAAGLAATQQARLGRQVGEASGAPRGAPAGHG